METRILGRTGLEVGMIGLGTEHLAANRGTMDAVLDLAVPAGVNYVDLVFNDPLDAHADYWNAVGPAVRWHRERLVLALHWGFVCHEPTDRCRLCFDYVLSRPVATAVPGTRNADQTRRLLTFRRRYAPGLTS